MTEPLNPFTYGNPISDPRRFYGRSRELEQVFSRLRDPEFESTSVVGEHRMGRSSLLLHTAHPDVVRQRGLDPNTYIFVYAHLDVIPSTGTPARFYNYVLRRIGSVIRDQELADLLRQLSQREAVDAYDLEDLFDLVDRKELYIVLLLDDFENIASNPNFGPEFYYGLRSLAIHHHLALVTASMSDLVDLSRTDTIRASPFFNIFATINLQPFSTADIQAMRAGSLEGSSVSFTDADVDQVVRFAGRQPFFLQIAFHFLFETHRAGEDPARRMAQVEERFQAAAEPHLLGYWQHSNDNERIVLMALALLLCSRESEQAPAPGTPAAPIEALFAGAGSALASLTRRGLVLRTPEGHAPFCTAFGRWVLQEVASAPPLTGAERDKEKPKDLSLSLPASIKGPAGKWLNTVHTKYKDLFAKWLSDPRSAERAWALLERWKDAFGYRELAAAGPVETAEGPPELPALTQAELEQAARHLPPQGTVSILFTDLEGSTAMFQTLGDQQARGLLRIHDHILRQWFAKCGGYEVKNTGDGFMVAFPSARKALACTIGIQKELDAFTRDHAATPLRVRMGLNAGEALQEEQDFFGSAVILAARIMAKGSGGQVLVSELFRRLVGTTAAVTYIDRGQEQITGFEEPQHVYEVDWRASKAE
ncbi:MAG: hypothetical protein HY535_07745 [Chloroflexi bacterium]|nr:hypothetical protein [Chloroflexota bacterium]